MRGQCTGQFAPTLDGALRRSYWCRWNASIVDLPPEVGVDTIFGESMPDEVFDAFDMGRDDMGRPQFFTVDSCPLAMIDPASPEHDPGVLLDMLSALREINAGLPSRWLPEHPSDCLREGLVLIKHDVDAAVTFRSRKNEKW